MRKANHILYTIKIFVLRWFGFVGGIITPLAGITQNLVPNPSFEDTSGCFLAGHPDINCTPFWTDYTLPNGNLNTADICYNTAVFFPPSSIPAFDGTNYVGVDCQPNNSEYVQTELLQTMQAGKSYCVSFYVSVCDQTMTPAISLGAYFSVNEMTDNPYTLGLSAHVQGNVPQDPTIWTKVTGVYTANGGEKFIILGGFENTGQPAFVYMYIDMVEVYELPNETLTTNLEICEDDFLTLQTATAPANFYLWNTGETTSTITISNPGMYYVEKIYGNCILVDSFLVIQGNCDPDTTIVQPFPVEEEQTLFIPSAFSPNGDGINDYFSVYGENLTELEILIFNRWGEIIFQSNNVNFTWDGKSKGVEAKNDVYVYQLRFKNQLEVTEERKGRIALIR